MYESEIEREKERERVCVHIYINMSFVSKKLEVSRVVDVCFQQNISVVETKKRRETQKISGGFLLNIQNFCLEKKNCRCLELLVCDVYMCKSVYRYVYVYVYVYV